MNKIGETHLQLKKSQSRHDEKLGGPPDCRNARLWHNADQIRAALGISSISDAGSRSTVEAQRILQVWRGRKGHPTLMAPPAAL